MKFKITSRVDSHHTNPKYKCLLIILEGDPHFHYKIKDGKLVKADWMPTDDEMMDTVLAMAKISPTFHEKIRNTVMWW